MNAEVKAAIAKIREEDDSRATVVAHATPINALRTREKCVASKSRGLRTGPVPSSSEN